MVTIGGHDYVRDSVQNIYEAFVHSPRDHHCHAFVTPKECFVALSKRMNSVNKNS